MNTNIICNTNNSITRSTNNFSEKKKRRKRAHTDWKRTDRKGMMCGMRHSRCTSLARSRHLFPFVRLPRPWCGKTGTRTTARASSGHFHLRAI